MAMPFTLLVSHCRMGRCHICYGPLSVFPEVHFHVLCVAISVTEFVNFNSETFVFLWDILLECNLPFEKYNHLVNYHMFRRVVKFEYATLRISKTSLSFHSLS
jgi:hypothetical protein